MRSSKYIWLFLFCFGVHNSFAQCAEEANIYTFAYNGHSYEVVKENKTWTDAVTCAVSRGGYLAEINDESEQNAIFDELTNNAGINIANTENQFGTASVWIGGSDEGTEGDWIWDGNNDGTGPQFWSGGPNGMAIGGAYTNWGTSPAEPDNSGGQDHLTIIIRPTAVNFGLWNDLVATNTIYYLIEHDQVLSVDELHLKSLVQVYPNPFTDVITINNSAQETMNKVEVYNLAGQKVKTFSGDPAALQKLDVAELPMGMYVLKIHFDHGQFINLPLVK